MAAPTPMNLTVPAGNISFSVQIRSQLAERAAYWRQQWTIEKDSKKKVFNKFRSFAPDSPAAPLGR